MAARHLSFESRLAHLYNIQGINRRLEETKLGEATSGLDETENVLDVRMIPEVQAKREEDDADEEYAVAVARIDSGRDQASSVPAKPSGVFQRSWNKAIVRLDHSFLAGILILTDNNSKLDATYMNGKIGQLSLIESLALQTKEAQRLLALRTAAERTEEYERLRALQSGERSKETRQLL